MGSNWDENWEKTKNHPGKQQRWEPHKAPSPRPQEWGGGGSWGPAEDPFPRDLKLCPQPLRATRRRERGSCLGNELDKLSLKLHWAE